MLFIEYTALFDLRTRLSHADSPFFSSPPAPTTLFSPRNIYHRTPTTLPPHHAHIPYHTIYVHKYLSSLSPFFLVKSLHSTIPNLSHISFRLNFTSEQGIVTIT